MDVWYGDYLAVHDVSLPVLRNSVTAMIGPSGCGKSTILRSLNRMNDLVPGPRVTGRVSYHGQDLYADDVDPIEVRRRIGMVFHAAQSVPEVHLRQRGLRPEGHRHAGRLDGRPGRGGPHRRGAVGRGQGQAEEQ